VKHQGQSLRQGAHLVAQRLTDWNGAIVERLSGAKGNAGSPGPAKSGSGHLAAQYCDFVAQDEDLDVFGCATAGEDPSQRNSLSVMRYNSRTAQSMIMPCALRIAEAAGHLTCDEFCHATR
jgi:hypothetical protein